MRHQTWRGWIVLALFLWLAVAWQSAASNEIARREGQLCTACHDKPGSKLLTDEGKYYELMRTLEGYEEVTVAFGDCTSCHVREPGSHQLTDGGELFAELVGDMEGLRRLLVQEHPVAPTDEASEAKGEDATTPADEEDSDGAQEDAAEGDRS